MSNKEVFTTDDVSRDRELPDLDTSLYSIVTYNKPAEAIGIIANLMHFDHRYAKLPFSVVVNDIIGTVAGNNYIVVVRKVEDKQQPVAFLAWNMLDEYSLTIRANSVRELGPSEVTRGHIPTLALFSSPFSSPHQMIEFMSENSKKLQEIQSIVGLDNFMNTSQTQSSSYTNA